MNQASSDWECWAALPPGAPLLRADDQRHRRLAAEHVAQLGGLVDDRLHRQRQEVEYMISATGRMPDAARRRRSTPAIASSDTGVSRTRSGPNSLDETLG